MLSIKSEITLTDLLTFKERSNKVINHSLVVASVIEVKTNPGLSNLPFDSNCIKFERLLLRIVVQNLMQVGSAYWNRTFLMSLPEIWSNKCL